MAANSAERVRAHRRRRRHGLERFAIEVDALRLVEILVGLRLLGAAEVLDRRKVEIALAAFTEAALRDAKKIL